MSPSQPFNYIDEANVTASNQYHGGNVHADLFKDVMRGCIRNLALLDKLKKSLFYGRELPADMTTGHYANRDFGDAFKFPQWLHTDDAKGTLILHSIIGIATEAGELLEMLYDSCIEGKPFDLVHFAEEVGDVQWYEAIGIKAAGKSFDDVQRMNIAKLRHRFPNAFTEFDANNRDLIGERVILESRTICGDGSGVALPEIGTADDYPDHHDSREN